MMSISCVEAKQAIERYVEGETPRESLAAAETHAETCLACERALREARALTAGIESALRAPLVPVCGADRVLAAVDAEARGIRPVARERTTRGSPGRHAFMALAATVVLAFGLSFTFYAGTTGPRGQTGGRPDAFAGYSNRDADKSQDPLGHTKQREYGDAELGGLVAEARRSKELAEYERAHSLYSQALAAASADTKYRLEEELLVLERATRSGGFDRQLGPLPATAAAPAPEPVAGLALRAQSGAGAGAGKPRSVEQRKAADPGLVSLDAGFDDVGQGALLVKGEGEKPGPGVAFPLERTAVEAEISGFLASTLVTQTFGNPYDRKIEAVYVFPLPATAAVNEFVMEIGNRRIRGIIREKKEAREIYEKAKAAGQVASLLEQERANVFTQSVANIEPGKRVDVRIRYFHTLPCDRGTFSYVFPMVVGHRYGSDARAEGHSNVTPPRLTPGTRSGHDVAVAIDLDAGVPIAEVKCETHDVEIERPADGTRARVRLKPAEAIANRDLVVEYRVGVPAETVFGVLAHAGDEGKFFTLLVAPPLLPDSGEVVARELFFILDSSGSMNGVPIEQSKRFMRHALDRMRPGDVFNVATFAGQARLMSEHFLEPTADHVGFAKKWIEALEGSGGTEAEKGIRLALEYPRDPSRMRLVVFLTDGGVSFEGDICKRIQESRGGARIFTLGVGSSPNRLLLDRMAEFGRGAAAYIRHDDPEEAIATKVDRLYAKIDAPVLVDVSIDWGGLEVEDVYPTQLPDLFVGQALAVHGRFKKGGKGTIKVRGLSGSGGAGAERAVVVDLPAAEPRNRSLAPVWARMKIEELTGRMFGAADEARKRLGDEVLALALEFDLVSAFTSFVAVDSASDTGAEAPAKVEQPVEVPAGVDPRNFGPGGER